MSRYVLMWTYIAALTGCFSSADQPGNSVATGVGQRDAHDRVPLERWIEEVEMKDAESLYREGTSLLESDPEKAIECLTRSLELAPNAPPALYNRVIAYASLGLAGEALADVERLEGLEPALGKKLRFQLKISAEPYVDIGNTQFESGNVEEALKNYTIASTYDPEHANSWVGKGVALNALGKTDEALECYNKAAELEPDNYWAYINRAELHHQQKRLKHALADFSRAIELLPEGPDPYSGRSAVYSDLGQPERAERDNTQAEHLRANRDVR